MDFIINFSHHPWIIKDYEKIKEEFETLKETKKNTIFTVNFDINSDGAIIDRDLYVTQSLTPDYFDRVVLKLIDYSSLNKLVEFPESDPRKSLEDYYKEPTYSRFFINNQYPLYGKIYTGTEEQKEILLNQINKYPNGILVKTDDSYKLITRESLYSLEYIGYGSGEQSYTEEFHTGEEDITKLPRKRWNPPAIAGLIVVCLVAILGTLFLGYLAGIIIFYIIWRRKSLRNPFLWALIWPIDSSSILSSPSTPETSGTTISI